MLEAVIIACLVGAALCFAYAAVALPSELKAQSAVKQTANKLTEVIGGNKMPEAGLAGATTPQAALTGGTEYVKALATLGEAMSKLRQGTAALLLMFGLIIFAGVAAGIDDKVADANSADSQEAAVSSR